MRRDQLAELLDKSSYASGACRHALLAGAHFILWEGSAPASRMLPAYERREAQAMAAGIATLGFAEAMTSLRNLGDQPVRLGQVTMANPPYLFMVFLAVDGATVVACLGVDQQHQSGFG